MYFFYLSSRPVLDSLRADGFELLRRACDEPGHLERLSGLDGLVGDGADLEGAILELSDEGDGGED